MFDKDIRAFRPHSLESLPNKWVEGLFLRCDLMHPADHECDYILHSFNWIGLERSYSQEMWTCAPQVADLLNKGAFFK
jgi:hypothetical protein